MVVAVEFDSKWWIGAIPQMSRIMILKYDLWMLSPNATYSVLASNEGLNIGLLVG